jgi:anti-sigma-K factor RskA
MNGNVHPTREEDFDLLALGALDGAEKQELESHLATCADCTRKLDEARGRVALLSLSAPQVKPSPAVKSRLMQQIRADASAPATTATPAPMPLAPRRPIVETETKPGFFGGWWTAVLKPVAVVLLLGALYLWHQNKQLDDQLAILRATIQTQQTQLDENEQISNLTAASDTIVVPLAAQPNQPAGYGRVIYNAQRGQLVYDGQLATAPADKSYQLWLVPTKGVPVSAGIFNPATGKTSHWLISLPKGISPAAFAVTLEPVNGSPQPTGPKVLVGPVS